MQLTCMYQTRKEPGQGEYRAGICLHQAITDSQQFRNEDELYEFFSDESKAHAFLKKYKLDNVCRITFRTPLDYLYAALPDGQDKPLLYFNLKLQKLCEEKQMLGQWDNMVKKHKKSKSKKPKYA